MVESLINPDVLSQLDKIREDFLGAKPFRHVIIDNFLKPEVAEAMLADFPSIEDPSTLMNEFGTPNPKSAISDVRSLGETYLKVDDYIQSPEFLDAMSMITGIPDLRYDPWYYGAGTHENFHGAGLEAHYDFNIHPRTAYHRRLNAIVYLNKDWNPDWRGDICFHSNPWDLKNDEKKSVQAIFNRCAMFETTENSWHSVTPVSLPPELRHFSRKSFTIYLYTETRPEFETAPEHGTVYVPPPLPAHIDVGHTLTAEDMAEINLNIARRHEYLKNMYKREYRFSSIIEGLKSQITDLKHSSYVPLIGHAKIKNVISPLYPDRWMGEKLNFVIDPLVEANRLIANVWRRDHEEDEYDILFRVGAQKVMAKAGPGMTRIELIAPLRQGEAVEVSLTSLTTKRANEDDNRDVSVIVDSIFIE